MEARHQLQSFQGRRGTWGVSQAGGEPGEFPRQEGNLGSFQGRRGTWGVSKAGGDLGSFPGRRGTWGVSTAGGEPGEFPRQEGNLGIFQGRGGGGGGTWGVSKAGGEPRDFPRQGGGGGARGSFQGRRGTWEVSKAEGGGGGGNLGSFQGRRGTYFTSHRPWSIMATFFCQLIWLASSLRDFFLYWLLCFLPVSWDCFEITGALYMSWWCVLCAHNVHTLVVLESVRNLEYCGLNRVVCSYLCKQCLWEFVNLVLFMTCLTGARRWYLRNAFELCCIII